MQRKREEQEEVGTRREERQIDPPIEEKSNTNYRLSRTGGGKLREDNLITLKAESSQ